MVSFGVRGSRFDENREPGTQNVEHRTSNIEPGTTVS